MIPRRGFSLIELLTVVTVMSLLIGVALPVLSRTRATRERVACMVNLRSFGQAVEAYRCDHGGLIPFADRPVDLLVGRADPIRAISQYLDVPAPATGSVGAPWACPADGSIAPAFGWSYWYTPIDLMAMLPRTLAQQMVTAWLDRDGFVVLIHDADRFHPGANDQPLTGLNCLRLDGGVEAGHPGLDVNPRQ